MSAFAITLRQAWSSWWSASAESGTAPLWAYSLVTFLFNSAFAVIFFGFVLLFGDGRDLAVEFGRIFVVSQCIGFSIQTLFMLGSRLVGENRIKSLRGLARRAYFSLIPLLGMALGYALGFALIGVDVPAIFASGRFWLGVTFIWALMTVIWWRFIAFKVKLIEAEREREQERARAADLERRALDAQLRTLQAQIEPHFLFNTLANVVSLIDSAPAQARHILERLIELLRASLAASRAPVTTLGQEVEQARAYLEVLALRMGPRLAFEIALPEALRAQPVPPLLVQPLIENAIEHGLEPKVEGGRIAVRVHAAGEAMQIEVSDDGLGFAAATTTGVGLSNLRERLAAHYGEAGRLTIEDANPGTHVRITLPRAVTAAQAPTDR